MTKPLWRDILWPAPPFPYQLIALAGNMRAGKDHLGTMLVKRYGFYKLRIAAPLYMFWNLCKNKQRKDRTKSCQMFLTYLVHLTRNESNISSDGIEAAVGRLLYLYKRACTKYKEDDEQARRVFLQQAGDLMRQFLGEYGLLNYCLSLVWSEGAQHQGDGLASFVITDLRLLVEAKAVLDWGGKVFVVESRPETLKKRLGSQAGLTGHATEAEISMIKNTPGVVIISGESKTLPVELKKAAQNGC